MSRRTSGARSCGGASRAQATRELETEAEPSARKPGHHAIAKRPFTFRPGNDISEPSVLMAVAVTASPVDATVNFRPGTDDDARRADDHGGRPHDEGRGLDDHTRRANDKPTSTD